MRHPLLVAKGRTGNIFIGHHLSKRFLFLSSAVRFVAGGAVFVNPNFDEPWLSWEHQLTPAYFIMPRCVNHRHTHQYVLLTNWLAKIK